ncbi:beta-1,6-N-acetylglucosaminyltransferase [Ancylobacter sp. 6x-1]|uniref:Peptide O-xylosyltransferase n=1 Tax=Ancylobacter crimeensis TaxID=2579147 RepID=A0ABT0D6N1_9HYPH|nr:beta-1,6-N-acetylglucosaminyltransferase [Ancylobacter crimeensis]MCK0195608.1 beta-1,6-N-acetylglucosaminyltransferase [Ancylobacter crimeensis]
MDAENIGYIVLAHGDMPQLKRLLGALDRHSPKFVHVDAKYTASLPDISEYNAEYVEPRGIGYWGSISLVDLTRSSMKQALRNTNIERLVLLSGSCFPIESPENIRMFFQSNQGKEYIDYFFVKDGSVKYQNKMNKYWIPDDIYMWLRPLFGDKCVKYLARLSTRAANIFLPLRKPSIAYNVAFGSQWWALTRESAEHVVDVLDGDKELRRAFKYTLAPDEMYIHTIVSNSPFSENIYGSRSFEGGGTFRKANLHFINEDLAKFCTLNDLNDVLASGKLFVRKVRSRDGVELCRALQARHVNAGATYPSEAGDASAGG